MPVKKGAGVVIAAAECPAAVAGHPFRRASDLGLAHSAGVPQTYFITPDQAAKILNVHRRTVIRLIHSGRLPALDVGAGDGPGKRIEPRIDPADLTKLKYTPRPTAPESAGQARRRRGRAAGRFVPLLRV